MKIRLLSDVHHEMGAYHIEELPDDKNTILVLAGDIGMLEKPYTYQPFLEDASSQFKHVIYIPGNHEFYKGSFPWSIETGLEVLADLPNVTFGDRYVKQIDDVAFVCATLWSDFEGGDPLSMFDCHRMMNDYRLIRTGLDADAGYSRKLEPVDTYKRHGKTVEWLFGAVQEELGKGLKVFVVTHHLPSAWSVPEQFRFDNCNGAYYSALDDKIESSGISVWVHGHTHSSSDYKIGDTRIVCNPVGYPGERNPKHDPRLVIEL